MYLPVLTAVRRHDPQLHRIQRMSGIPTGQFRQKFHGLLIYHRLIGAHALVLVIHGPLDQRFDILNR